MKLADQVREAETKLRRMPRLVALAGLRRGQLGSTPEHEGLTARAPGKRDAR